MRFALLWVTGSSFAASALARHLPPEILASIYRLQPSPNVLLDAQTNTSTLPYKPGASLGDSNKVNKENTDSSLAEFASDELWYKHMRKGTSLNCGMRGSDVGAGYQIEDTRDPPSAASIWTGSVAQLVEWYWWEAAVDARVCDMDMYWGLGSIFKELGVDPRSKLLGGDLECFQITHSNENAKYPDGKPKEVLAQSYKVDGKLYHATDASHFFSMDIRAGVIVGIALSGPEAAAEHIWGRKPLPDELPKLRRVSDIYWAYWSSLHNAAGTSVDNINKYVVFSIQNRETDQIIARALRDAGREDVEEWPGQYFTTESTAGLALLGSPIGATIGYMLMQHKKELGNKYVTGVRILRNDDHTYDVIQGADLVFYIADVPPGESIPDAPGEDPKQDRPQSDGRIARQPQPLTLRSTNGHSIEEEFLGSNNILRVHTIMAY